MARSPLARMGTVVVFAVTLAACDRTPTGTSANSILPPGASLARGSSNAGGNGGGKGSSTTTDQPKMAISPTQLSVAVGQQAIVSVTYWDRRGNIVPVTDERLTYYGCYKLLDSDPDCWSIVSIVPGGSNNRQATVIGNAPGTVQVWASDGLGTWVTSVVTVQ